MTPTNFPPAASSSSVKDERGSRRGVSWIIATCGGIGYMKPGPGTWAAVAATLVWFALAYAAHLPAAALCIVTGFLALFSTSVGIAASTQVASESGIHDPGFVVVDEAAGQWVALLAACLPNASWKAALVSLILFRAFDIWKPWPVSALERLPEGWGIMLDDVAAGIYALVLTALLRHFLSGRVLAIG
jgi:phosphatidylglycerophosphatase A